MVDPLISLGEEFQENTYPSGFFFWDKSAGNCGRLWVPVATSSLIQLTSICPGYRMSSQVFSGCKPLLSQSTSPRTAGPRQRDGVPFLHTNLNVLCWIAIGSRPTDTVGSSPSLNLLLLLLLWETDRQADTPTHAYTYTQPGHPLMTRVRLGGHAHWTSAVRDALYWYLGRC